ncbi:putative membrane protein YabM [Lentibacillus populi]|uniref:Membrane protein YabM n=1 Tax=Lentibacillus populi TaxID=1827502 RepID=A0A9W5TZG3_9BACI|nr:polysaccharide biosynthesis protein [Lentibacillus populi]GGB51159.1 putative membrane protein YabM [Lentibacillus populi]
MDGNESNKLVKGALILTMAGVISKVLSAGYRIPLQNLTGDIGFYIYQQVYPFLGIALVLSLYGFPPAIAKMAVEIGAKDRQLSYSSFYIPILSILFVVNGAIFLFLFLNAHEIAIWMGNIHLETGLEYTAFAFLLIPLTALLRGVFQGSYQMTPTALSQIGEQTVRVVMIIFAAAMLTGTGKNIYEIGIAAAIASIAGSVMAFVVLGVYFLKHKPIGSGSFPIPWGFYLKTLLIFGVIAALNHMLLLVIQFADAFTLVPGLMEYGLSQHEAMAAKGVFDRGQPLIQLGTVIGSSFALALIPSISKQKLEANPIQFHHYIRSTLKFSFYLAVGATIGLIIIFPDANMLLFQNDKGTASLRILVMAIVLCSIAITASSILQGLGYLKRTAAFIFIAFFIKWIANQVLVPLLGITGSAIATVISLLILSGLVMIELKRKLPDLLFWKTLNWRALIISGLGMAIYLLLIDFSIHLFTYSRFGLLIYVLFVVLSGAAVYLVLLLKNKAFTEEELMMLPFSSFLVQLHKGRRKRGSKN